jgi:hypothetical protein
MITYIWAVLGAALLLFLLWKSYRLGYTTGGKEVLNEWKKYMDMGEENNE